MNITHHKNGDIKTLVEEAPYHPGYEDVGFKPTTIKSNANELAKMLFHYWNKTKGVEIPSTLLNDAADMLRQQQAEIEALKQSKSDDNNKVNYELTDEEIKQLAYQHRWNGDVDFARAILRKAQEK